MNNFFHQIKPTLVFNLKRFLKNKTWIILTSIFTVSILILYIFFAIYYRQNHTISITLMVVIPNVVALVYIGIISLIIISQLFIQDNTSGVYGLEKRMGRKTKEIFWAKYFVQKILVYSWIFFDFLLFLLFVPTIAHFDAQFLLSMSCGIFALFLFEWLFSGILYLVSLSSNIKLLSAIAGFLMTLLAFFPLIGPAFRELNGGLPQQTDIALFYYKEKTKDLRSKYKNGILEQMNNDLIRIYENDIDGALYKYELDNHSSIFSFLDQGVATKDKIEALVNHQKVQKRPDLIATNSLNIDYWYNDSFTCKFFSIIENDFQLKESKFEDSWFNQNQFSNYQNEGQLKDFLTIIKTPQFLEKLNQKTNNDFQLDELKDISNLVTEQFKNYYLVKLPHSSGSTSGVANGSGFFQLLKNIEVDATVKINEGQRLFTRILLRSVSYAEINLFHSDYFSSYTWDLGDFNESYRKYNRGLTSISFIFNPFNAMLGGSIYSGIDSFVNDAKIDNSYYPKNWDFLRTLSIRQLKINFQKSPVHENRIQIIKIQESKKLLSIGGLYGFYFIFQGLTIGITFIVWLSKNKKNPKLKQKTK